MKTTRYKGLKTGGSQHLPTDVVTRTRSNLGASRNSTGTDLTRGGGLTTHLNNFFPVTAKDTGGGPRYLDIRPESFLGQKPPGDRDRELKF